MLFRLIRAFRGIIYQQKILAVLLVVVIGSLAWLAPAHAMGFIATVLSGIAQVIITLVGKIFVVLIEILLAVVKYNDFINAPAVVKAWVLVRDVANMAFLIIFIAIAFATILGVEKYEYKQLLPKLLIMAVVINFSRTICGIIIDAAQVVMMTFVNGFKDVAAGNLIRGFGVTDMISLRKFNEGESPVDDNAIAAASILAVIMLIIATVTVGIMVIMFVVRVIFLWILIVLSPFAFMLSAAPGMSDKFNEWWSKFTRYVIVGPLLAFFLWLAFSIMASVDPGQNLATQNQIFKSDTIAERTSASITAIGSSDNLLSFAIAISLLLLALSTANSIGVAGGSLAGTAMAKIQSGGIKLAKLGALVAATGGVGAAVGAGAAWKGRKFAGRRFEDYVSPGLTKWTAKGLSRATKAVGLGETRLGKFLEPIAEQGTQFRAIPKAWKSYKTRREAEKETKAVGAMEDAFYGALTGRRTTRAEQSEAALVNQRAKELAETSKDSDYFVQEFKRAAAAGDKIGMKAALQNSVMQNDQNSQLRDPENAKIAMKAVQDNFKKLYGEVEGMRKYQEMYQDMDGNMTEAVVDPTHWAELIKHYLGDNSDTARFESTLGGIALEKGSPAFFATTKLDPKTGKYKMRDLTSITPDNPGQDGNFWDMTPEQRDKYIDDHVPDKAMAAEQKESKKEFFDYVNAVLGKARTAKGSEANSYHPLASNIEVTTIDPKTGRTGSGYAKQANPVGNKILNLQAGSATARILRGERADNTDAGAGHHPSQGEQLAVDALANFYWRQARTLVDKIALHKENAQRSRHGLPELRDTDEPTVGRDKLMRQGFFKRFPTLKQQEDEMRRMAEEVVRNAGALTPAGTSVASAATSGAAAGPTIIIPTGVTGSNPRSRTVYPSTPTPVPPAGGTPPPNPPAAPPPGAPIPSTPPSPTPAPPPTPASNPPTP